MHSISDRQRVLGRERWDRVSERERERERERKSPKRLRADAGHAFGMHGRPCFSAILMVVRMLKDESMELQHRSEGCDIQDRPQGTRTYMQIVHDYGR